MLFKTRTGDAQNPSPADSHPLPSVGPNRRKNRKRPVRDFGLRPPAYLCSRPVKDAEARRQWSLAHDCCQVCGIDDRAVRWTCLVGLQTHHIIKAGRSDEPCNLLRVCDRCYRIIEGDRMPDGKGGYLPRLGLAHVLYCKRERDPHEYDANRLTMLWRNRQRAAGYDPLPLPAPLPPEFLAERRRWCRARYDRPLP